jgi:glyoxylase-like metal-dependent hydrolase (beta-lactamase superfamily II)
MIVKPLSVGPLQIGCYVIGDEKSKEGAIIDPGGDAARILDAANALHVRYVINTHAHFDHTMANGRVLKALRTRQGTAPELIAHSQAAPLLANGGVASLFGFPLTPSPEPDRFVGDGDVLKLGSFTLEVLHTPGHSPGSITLYCAEEGVLFVGDVFFRRGVGRCDLPGGDWDTLVDSIRTRLFALPDDTVVYPGHGPPTTIGEEKRGNPFLI